MSFAWHKSYPQGVPPEIDVQKYSSIVEAFEESVKKFRDRPAYHSMGKTITYHELDLLSRQFASFLQHELKMKKGDRVAIQLPNLLQFPIAMFGILRAGMIVVNTNPLYTAREMEHQLKDSGSKAILILANFASHLEEIIGHTEIEHVILTEIGDSLSFPKRLIVNSVVKHIKKMVPEFYLPKAYDFIQALELGKRKPIQDTKTASNDLAFLQYTGGTTGVAKGAMLTHANIVANMLQIVAWMRPILKEGQEIILSPLPLYHIFSLTVTLTFMEYGAMNILIANPRDMKAFVGEMKKFPFTVMTGVNTLFNSLLHNEEFLKLNLSRVKVSVAGGMALQTTVAKKWKELTKSLIVEGYGLTETSPVASVNPVTGGDRAGSIGLPVPNTELRLLDDSEQEVGPGQSGEICIRGPQVMLGYWNRPDETAKVMTKDGFFKSGDVGIMEPDGFFKIVDRKKDMILVSGFNVYPNEIEEVLSAHPGVLEVAAIGVPDERSGEVVKVVIVKKSPSLTVQDILDYSKENLTGYKVPKVVEFRTELPKTNVGKILRRALRDAPTMSSTKVS